MKNKILNFFSKCLLWGTLLIFLNSCSSQSKSGYFVLRYDSGSNKYCNQLLDSKISNKLLSIFYLNEESTPPENIKKIFYKLGCNSDRMERFVNMTKYIHIISIELKLSKIEQPEMILSFLPRICIQKIDLEDKGKWFTSKIKNAHLKIDEDYFKSTKAIQELTCDNEKYKSAASLIRELINLRSRKVSNF
jgi:hypothetical protein